MWIALLNDELTVVGSGKTLQETLLKAKKRGYEYPILARMPENLNAFANLRFSEQFNIL
jgi:hypothetical protein